MSSRAGGSEMLRRPVRKGQANLRRNRRRKLFPRRLGGREKTRPLSSVAKRMERYREVQKLESFASRLLLLLLHPVCLHHLNRSGA
jgi:hypothetical protein